MSTAAAATVVSLPGPAAPSEHRIPYLDALRGIASVIVSCGFHLQNLASPIQPDAAPISDLPLYQHVAMKLLLKAGGTAVDLFFIISGVVFSHVYLERIRERRIGAREFFLLRLSRLYPIHLATLLVSAVLVWTFAARFGRPPIYPVNDARAFVLNLLFLQRGFFDTGYSFNGPAWSLSVEAFLYLVFFALALRAGRSIALFAVPLLLGVAIYAADLQEMFLLNEDIARGLVGFFAGVLLFHALFTRRAYGSVLATCGGAALMLGMVFAIHGAHRLMFPASWIAFVLLLVALERFSPLRAVLAAKPLRLMGDASLSIYLVHVPIQVALLLAYKLSGREVPIGSLGFVLAYSAGVIAVGLVAHVVFEQPARTVLRRLLLGSRAA